MHVAIVGFRLTFEFFNLWTRFQTEVKILLVEFIELWDALGNSHAQIFIQRPEVTCNRLCYQRIGVIEQWGQQESYIKMPKFVVETNVSEKDFPADWHKSATELIAKLLGKPIQASSLSYHIYKLQDVHLCYILWSMPDQISG